LIFDFVGILQEKNNPKLKNIINSFMKSTLLEILKNSCEKLEIEFILNCCENGNFLFLISNFFFFIF